MTENKKSQLENSQSGELTDGIDMPRIEAAVREILSAVGEDPDREGLIETPARVARMYAELFRGLHEEPREHLQKFFTEQYDEIVLVRDISFNSMCEHHMLPFMGKAHIGYLPDGKVVGLSKLARVVESIARRPQVQERMTETIANLLVEELNAKGVAVIIEAVHTCMTVRGVRKPGSVCVTSAYQRRFPQQNFNPCGNHDPHLRPARSRSVVLGKFSVFNRCDRIKSENQSLKKNFNRTPKTENHL